jgi:hypothetical protein
MEVKMVIAFYMGHGKGGAKVIKVEGGREKEKEVIVRREVVSSKYTGTLVQREIMIDMG